MARNVKLLLTENVDNLGIVGDVVNVRSGYARNFLLPRAMATKPTEGAVKRLASRRAEVEKQMKEQRVQLEALLEKVKDKEITIQRSANEQGILFGGVSQHEIAQALQAEGLPIEDRQVRIGAQIKRLDSYHIPIVLANDLKTEIKLWVVSDRPMEEGEQAHGEGRHGEGAAAATETEEPKPKKKSKRTEAAEAATAEAEEGEKKSKKAAAGAEGAGDDEKPAKKKGKKSE